MQLCEYAGFRTLTKDYLNFDRHIVKASWPQWKKRAVQN